MKLNFFKIDNNKEVDLINYNAATFIHLTINFISIKSLSRISQ